MQGKAWYKETTGVRPAQEEKHRGCIQSLKYNHTWKHGFTFGNPLSAKNVAAYNFMDILRVYMHTRILCISI